MPPRRVMGVTADGGRRRRVRAAAPPQVGETSPPLRRADVSDAGESRTGLDECGEVVQGHPRAELVVGGGDAIGDSLVHDDYVGPAVRVYERRLDRHLAPQVGVRRLELEHLYDLLAGHQSCEMAAIR